MSFQRPICGVVEDKKWLKDLARYSSWGFDFAASVLLLTYLGYWLDKKYDTQPWLTITGAMVGAFLGYYTFWKGLKHIEEEKDK